MAQSTRGPRQVNIRLAPELVDALDRIRDADGVPVSEQIRRGIVLWLESKGAAKPKARKKPTK
jgi:hypothetical protein